MLGLDTVSCVQAMISRPIVAGALAGLALGDPVAGVWAGAVLEIVSLHQLPIGANRHWDTGPASVAAVVAMTSWPGSANWLVSAGFGVLVGWAGSWTVYAMRHLNARLVVKDGQPAMMPSELLARHVSAMAIDFLRAAALTLVAVWVVVRTAAISGDAPADAAAAISLVLLACVCLAIGADVTMMARGRRVWTAFGAGAALSTILWLWLG